MADGGDCELRGFVHRRFGLVVFRIFFSAASNISFVVCGAGDGGIGTGADCAPRGAQLGRRRGGFRISVSADRREFFVFTVSSRDGTWGSPGYWQVGFVPLLQVVSVAGLPGLVFAMTLPASAIAVAWYRAWENRPWFLAAGVPLGVFAAIVIFGVVRLAMSHLGPRVRVGLIATDIHEGYSKTEDADKATALIGVYASEIATAAQKGAQVVVIPEKTVGMTPGDRDAIVQVLSNVAKTSHVWLVAGVNELEQSRC